MVTASNPELILSSGLRCERSEYVACGLASPPRDQTQFLFPRKIVLIAGSVVSTLKSPQFQLYLT